MYSIKSLFCYFRNEQWNIMSMEESERYIGERIEGNIPTMIGRMGSCEVSTIIASMFGSNKKKEKMCKQLCECAGFFPREKRLLSDFSEVYIEALKCIDYIHPLNCKWNEYLYHEYLPKTACFIENPGVWDIEKPWTKHLENKKVLVIHPFVKTIEEQYMKREVLFENKNILPQFELQTIRAVQTIANERDERFSNWFEALDWMKDEIDRRDYDIALIGCGAYGFPLAAHVKKRGKIGVHMGSDVQLLFGIWGSRWNKSKKTLKLRNEFWTVPSKDETPKNFQIVENGAYWA